VGYLTLNVIRLS